MKLLKAATLFKASVFLFAGASIASVGCGAPDELDSGPGEELGEIQEAITGGWTNLTLVNGWTAASGSTTPAVGIVNGVVTFRGDLAGQSATANVAFCLTEPTFTQFRPTDVGFVTLRATLANNSSGSLILGPANNDDPPAGFCMAVWQHGLPSGSQPGPNARIRTSLEGVSYDRSFHDSIVMTPHDSWQSAYPSRGSDDVAPPGTGVLAKVVNGFVRFQGVLRLPGGDPGYAMFTLPSGQGMIPNNPVYLPISACALGPSAARIVIQPNGDVVPQFPAADAMDCGLSLDGASYSMSSPSSAVTIPLSNGWVPFTNRAVRARVSGGVVRLEGMVTNGNGTTIGTLPQGMRPTRTIDVVADAFNDPATGAVLRISSSGTIRVIAPPLTFARAGTSLDGVSFAN